MKTLIIDDDQAVCSSLKLLLNRNGYEAISLHLPATALEVIAKENPLLIVLDMNFTIDTSGKQGIKLLTQIREKYPKISVVLMTGWATVQLAVKGMKLGAKDFIAKPWDNKDLLNSLNSIQKIHHPVSVSNTSITNVDATTIIGDSPAMIEVMTMVDLVAMTEASVLITGESGTGKELIAEAIHHKSHRGDNPFVKVNLGGIPTNLFESEMFGHKKGAFTGAHDDRVGRFEKSNTGTIFLDEIGEVTLENQVKLLRVLQEKTFEPLGSSDSQRIDVRVVSATNQPIKQMAIDGSFREDLFYRINLLHIHLPSLSERKTDIPKLVKYFLNNVSSLYNTDRPHLDEETANWLSNQEYKGNIRQLKNVVERTFLMNLNKKKLVQKDFLPGFSFSSPTKSASSELNLQEMEINTINKALAKHGHSISNAAKALGITRSSLYRRIEKYNIQHEPKI